MSPPGAVAAVQMRPQQKAPRRAGSSRGPADDDEDDVEDMDDMGSDSDDASPTNKGKPNGKRPAGPLKTSDS